MFRRLEEAQDPDDPDPQMRTVYTDKFPIPRLEKVVKESLVRIGAKEATESMKQKFLQSLGTLRRKESENVRYKTKVDQYITVSTMQRQSDSVSAAELRSTKTFFYTDQTRATLIDEQVEFFDEAAEAGSGFKTISVTNRKDFKTPLNATIPDSDNEQRFFKMLLQPQNVACYDSWIKSTATRFYEIDYAWKKGEHPKRGKFNPDVFIKAGNLIIVVEIKGDEELREPSEENKKKNEYALAHFERVNENLKKQGSPIRYKFTFLSERSFNIFFQSLREGKIRSFKSELDVRLAEAE
jgi:type III restriction enzyme